MIFNQKAPSVVKVTGPSGSMDSGYSASYDWSGLDDHIKRQGLLSQLRDAKFAANYGGRIEDAVPVGNQVRELVNTLRVYAPGTTERSPNQFVNPLVKKTSESSDSKSSFDAGDAQAADAPNRAFEVPPIAGGGKGGGKPGAPPAIPRPPEMRQADEDAMGIIPNQPARRKPKPRLPGSVIPGSDQEMYA